MEAFDRKPATDVDSSQLDFDNILTGMGMDKLIDDLLGDEDFDDSADEEESKELFEEMRKKAKRWTSCTCLCSELATSKI